MKILPLILSTLVSLTLFAQPTISIKEVDINGYTAFLVNTHKGNLVSLAFNVFAGAWHDEPIKHAGRAHLWEHVIHRSSENFPNGWKHFVKLATRIGGSNNAETSLNHIRYFYNLHPDALNEVVEYLGDMTSSPAWNKNDYEAERPIVMNEALEAQSRDSTVLMDSILLETLPPSHPLKKYHVGTQKQLSEMTLDDLKELFYSTYTPKSAQIFVVGNFDPLPNGEKPLEEKTVIKILEKNFFPSDINKDPDGYSHPKLEPLTEKIFPPITSESTINSRLIELGTSNNSHTMEIFFEVPTDIEKKFHNSIEMLLDFFNQNLKGGLSSILKEKGLILRMYAGNMSANNLKLKFFNFELTAEGAKRKYEIYEILFAYLNKISEEGLSKEVLSYLTDLNVFSYEQSIEDTTHITSLIPNLIRDFGKENALDFRKRFGEVTNEDIKFLARNAISSKRMIGGYIGPETKSKERSAIFERPIKRVDSETLIKKLEVIHQNGSQKHPLDITIELPQIAPNFDKNPLPGENDLHAKTITFPDGTFVILKENHTTSQGAIILRLFLPPQTLKIAVLNEALLASFKIRYAPELTFFQSLGLLEGINLNHRGIDITLKGNTIAQIQTLKWIISKLSTFIPTKKEALYSKQMLINKFNGLKDDFSAHMAISSAFSMLLNYRHYRSDILDVLENLSFEKINNYSEGFLKRSDLLVSAVGDYNIKYFDVLFKELTPFIPQRLTQAQREKMNEFSYTPKGSVVFWDNPGENKAIDALGLTYFYKIENSDAREKVALEIFSAALRVEITNLNREIKGLGYVHGASLFDTQKELFLGVYGQADNKLNHLRMTLGWEEILSKIKANEKRILNFDDLRTGIIRGIKILPDTLISEATEHFSNYLQYKDPNYRVKLEKVVNSLTDDYIYKIGRNALLKSETPTVTVISSNTKPCEKVFSSFGNARKRLKASF